ncbi:MAG: carbohydrate-binding domain-containing protein [Lachnospiraceae bacterium]
MAERRETEAPAEMTERPGMERPEEMAEFQRTESAPENGGAPGNGAGAGNGGGPGNGDTNSSGEERETPPDMGDMTPPGQNDGNSDSGSNADESDDDTLDDADDVTDSVSRKGLKAGLLLSISGGTYELDCADDSLHSNGDLTVSGGVFTMAAGDDGAHADGTLTVNGGEMEITTCYEGLEGTEIDVTGGSVTLTASDDGINAAGDAGAVLVSVSGGILQINASGDGLDSNGDIVMTGGKIYVSGPTGDGNGSLDYSGECRIDGGLLFLAGSTGMIQNPGEDSGQNTITVVYSEQQEAGTEVSLRTDDEAVIASFTPAKAYASIQVSAPELDDGTVVSLYSGEEKLGEITASGSVTVADETGAETSVGSMRKTG